MNNDFSPKEAKQILNLLKQGFNLNLGGGGIPPVPAYGAGYAPKAAPVKATQTPSPVKMAPDYLGGGGENGKAILSGIKNVGSKINSGLANAGNAFRGAMAPKTTPAPAGPGLAPDYLGGNGEGLKTLGNMMRGGSGPTPVAMGPLEKGTGQIQPQNSQNLAMTPATPAANPVENAAMQIQQPNLQARGITPTTQQPIAAAPSYKFDLNSGAPTLGDGSQGQLAMSAARSMPAPTAAPAQAAPQFSGDVTDQERQLLRKLHASNFNPNSKRDQQMLEHLRTAGREAGGYDDFKTLRNLAYANQYGAKSDYGRLAQKWRDGRAQQIAGAQGMAPKAGEYTVLTRRNTGVTTTEGNVWINPTDREWLSKSAAYSDLSWEDYCGLMPSDAPESIQQFFN